jgi:uncharacterized membrane protein
MFDHYKAAWPIVKANLVGWIIFSIVARLMSKFSFGILGVNAIRATRAAIARQEAPSIGELFNFDNISGDAVSVIVEMIGVLLGCLACLVGMPIMAFLLTWMPELAADNKFAGLDAAKASMHHVKRNIGAVLLFGIASMLVRLAGVAVCGVGVFVANPLNMVARALFYEANATDIMATAQAAGVPTKP